MGCWEDRNARDFDWNFGSESGEMDVIGEHAVDRRFRSMKVTWFKG